LPERFNEPVGRHPAKPLCFPIMIARRVIFEGRVQGVGFRYTVKDLARGFDVCGWVKNLADGSVELQVMGEAAEVRDFLHEITVESPVARHIKNQIVSDIPLLENLSGFRIER
jgi:acylphosphatase